jgi:hypothetical protein
VPEEAVRRDLELERGPRPLPASVGDDSDEDLVLRLGRGEGSEVVLAEEERRGLRQANQVERARPPERPPPLERRVRGPVPDAVAVRTRAGGEAGVEVVCGRLRGDCRDVVRKHPVQRLSGSVRRRATLRREARHLGDGVNAGVCAPSHRQPAPLRIHLVEGGAQLPLDGAEPGLDGPAVELRPVVLQRQPDGRHGVRLVLGTIFARPLSS